MSDIGLRDYLAKLDALFDSGDANQVIHHCRQILQYYPKNVEAYRILGRALLETQSFAEAGEVFRRVLSVFPDDLTAHIGLSEVALQDKRPDDAIWHMERAFEVQSSNAAIQAELQRLYGRRDGMEPPLVYWVPSIATSGMTFYTNDRIPQWKGNLFVGGMQQGRIPGTGQIQRISFNSRWEEVSREPMLGSLNQRMREIREGPDGSLYILTDEDAGVLLRVEPTDTTKRTAK